MKVKGEKKSNIKKFCQRFQIGMNKVASYDSVKHRLGWRFYSDEQLKARERFRHEDLMQ